ncbi:MAG: hypothetical protein KBG02_12810 [Haliscomenobacter sp.]|nr:hypothetical protein [Haliscomenobacter sp.]MBK8655464.1 hypothetical protein [Haliscomenobacter sp.]MBP9077739.1 hypothetical protein [Haliscomenobacter sp.]MBP9874596.1 hypothetical protein [Haliscomenobacter sp.]
MRKGLLCLLLFGSLGTALFGQDIPALEQAVQETSGLEQFKTLIALSDAYFGSGDFQKSLSAAQKAETLAATLQNLNYPAEALFRKGRAQANMEGRAKAQAVQSLEKSLRLAGLKNNTALQQLNLEVLSALAIERGKPKEIARYKEILAESSGNKPDATIKPLPPPPPALTSPGEATSIRGKLDELSKELSAQKQERDSINRERLALTQTINLQQKAIESMNEAQAKAQLNLEYQKRLVDSLTFEKELDSMQLANNVIILQQKQSELKLQSSQRNLFLAIAAMVFLLSVGLYLRYRNIRTQSIILKEKNQIIEQERQRAENLLLNILPAAIAEELKLLGRAKARQFDQATVMFSDFKNFTAIAETLTPDALVKELDHCFRAFDQIIGKYHLEKIKTIGDAYMVVGGLPDPDPDHPRRVIAAAIEMLRFLEDYQRERRKLNLPFFEARVGVHTGPLVAGVVGDKKFAYDVWGDTVNVAARMESGSEPGRINISAETYKLVQQEFQCVHRGKIQVKNKGEVDMYFVEN